MPATEQPSAPAAEPNFSADPSTASPAASPAESQYDMIDPTLVDSPAEAPAEAVDSFSEAPAITEVTPPTREEKAAVIASTLPDEPEDVAAPVVEPPAELPGDFDEPLLEMAARHGFPREIASTFGNSANLRRAIAAIDARAIELTERAFGLPQQPEAGWQDPTAGAAQQPIAGQPATGPTPLQQPATAPAAPQQGGSIGTPDMQAAAFEKFKVELDPRYFDADTIQLVNGLNDHYDKLARQHAGEIDQLKNVLSAVYNSTTQITGRVQAEESAREERELDAFFQGLGDEFKDVYGQGPIRSLAAGSDALKARQSFRGKMKLLEWSDAHDNRPPSSRSEMAERVKYFLHPEKVQTSVRRDLASKIEKRNRQAIARPSGRQTEQMTGEDKARQRLREFNRSHGFGYEDDDTPDAI